MRALRATSVCCFLALTGAFLAGDLRAASPKEQIRQKQAQAQAVLAQVNALDRTFEKSVEAWNGARYELAATQKELAVDRRSLRIAERARQQALARVRARLLALYEADDSTSTIAVLLGSTTMNQALARLDAAQTVAAADHALAAQTTSVRNHYAVMARRTSELERRRAASVVRRARERQRIASLLEERKRLLESVRGEVARLQAQEARRQAALAAAARRQLAEARAAAQRAAAQRAAAAERAAAQRAAAARTTTTTAAPVAPPQTVAPAPEPAPATTEAVPSAPAPAPSLVGGHPEAARIALRYLGTPYVWGGASTSGFDCSGLVMYVYAQLGIQLPHFAAAQFGMGTPVPRDELQPGDLVFFDGLNHVGIYIGGGEIVHAPHTGDVVKISPISDFGSGYVGARRL